jgi:N-acyl-L-homoserine lactone synthetase
MIRLINGMDYTNHGDELDQMFRLRKRIFAERLKWDVGTFGHYEIDEYDMRKPLYVLAMDVSGCFQQLAPTCLPIRFSSCSLIINQFAVR